MPVDATVPGGRRPRPSVSTTRLADPQAAYGDGVVRLVAVDLDIEPTAASSSDGTQWTGSDMDALRAR